jgi:NAD(P)-dependent dehydrogenase (short-subunit alcohol dehydrogenase family)
MNVLITGGSSGLGRSIVEKLCSEKTNHIYFTYNNSIQNMENICSQYPNTTPIKCDFTNDLELNIFTENFKKIDINVLINNFYSWPKNSLMPGSFLTKNFHKIDHNSFIDEFKNNIIPTVLITQEAIKYFRKNKNGKIITVLSSIIETPTIGSSLYVSNKNYLSALSKVWAVENKRFNISSNTISPSFMLTPQTLKMDEKLMELYKNSTDKLMTVEHVSDKILSFLNDTDVRYDHDIPL